MMFTDIEFERHRDGTKVFIQPRHVVKVEGYMPATSGPDQPVFVSLLTLVAGGPEIIVGPPSVVLKRLRGGQ